MGSRQSSRREQPQVVTDARPPRSQDIMTREKRYLVLMGIRLVCLVLAIVMYSNHLGWLVAIPAAGAIVLPYFAVVIANASRANARGRLQPYEPRLPARQAPRPQDGGPADGDGPEGRSGARSQEPGPGDGPGEGPGTQP